MTDFSKCPSCKVKANAMKDGGTVQFDHLSDCQVGFTAGKGSQCTRCNATMTYAHVDIKRPGTWLAARDCPICWAEAEALGIES